MKKLFVEGLSNQVRFEKAIRDVENRGSPEANWVVVESRPGYGKTGFLQRYAVLNRFPYVRVKAECTSNWLCSDICSALNIADNKRSKNTKTMLNEITNRLMLMQPNVPYLVVDEMNHAAKKESVLETLRDISDTAETIVIVGANDGTYAAINNYDRIRSRVAALVNFGPLTADDMKMLCGQLTDVKIAPDLQARILREMNGELRAIRDVIASIERSCRTAREPITSEMWGKKSFIGEHRTLRLAVNNA